MACILTSVSEVSKNNSDHSKKHTYAILYENSVLSVTLGLTKCIVIYISISSSFIKGC